MESAGPILSDQERKESHRVPYDYQATIAKRCESQLKRVIYRTISMRNYIY